MIYLLYHAGVYALIIKNILEVEELLAFLQFLNPIYINGHFLNNFSINFIVKDVLADIIQCLFIYLLHYLILILRWHESHLQIVDAADGCLHPPFSDSYCAQRVLFALFVWLIQPNQNGILIMPPIVFHIKLIHHLFATLLADLATILYVQFQVADYFGICDLAINQIQIYPFT